MCILPCIAEHSKTKFISCKFLGILYLGAVGMAIQNSVYMIDQSLYLSKQSPTILNDLTKFMVGAL